ncbi:high-affinity nitrate transporter-activating protein 2.1-like [Magnolia sinica]|uniref:high-affinity nitrate transporter-activating protein 2.1-like n=1 Tax=Magnolia sinica TaxID=86752 RepID=UPI0026596B9F|nr:high-affinity nitrate transporter-activating protein 2.1-like [Magnolia sinica]
MASRFFVAPLFLFCFVGHAFGGVLFSSLPPTLLVQASPKQGTVLNAGKDVLTVQWGLNGTQQGGLDSKYEKVKITLCYAPISQEDRAWRKTVDDLSKDKTCQFEIVVRPYSGNKKEESFDWTIERDVPTATYFVRAYALDSAGKQVAYGQTTDSHKTTNLFGIEGITGRHVSLDIAAACFSAFSVVSLFGFFLVEKRKAKKTTGK